MLKRLTLILALCLMLVGCKTIEYVPIEKVVEKEIVKRDSIYITKIKVDSIKEVDSVYVNTYIKGDTIYQDKYKYVYRYKDKVRVDTLWVFGIDSVIVDSTKTITLTKEVEKKLTKWQSFKQDVGGISIGIVIVLLLYLMCKIYRRFKV